MENNQALIKFQVDDFGLEKALQSPQIRYVDRIKIDAVVQPAVYKAFMNRGQFEIEQEKIDHIVTTLGDSILKTCPNIRLDEIPIAIEKGVLGAYGDYIGINVVSLVNFVKVHYASPERSKTVNSHQTIEVEIPKVTESEILKKDKELLIKAFEQFEKTGHYEDYGNYIYKVAAKKFNLFQLADQKKKEYLKLGKNIAIERIKSELAKFPNQRNKYLEELNQAVNLIAYSDGVKKVYKEALQLALNDWFRSLVEMEVNVEELFVDTSER